MLFMKAQILGNRLHVMPNRICAMPHSAEFLQTIASPTPRYATQREIQV
jgi:hypothetical protein